MKEVIEGIGIFLALVCTIAVHYYLLNKKTVIVEPEPTPQPIPKTKGQILYEAAVRCTGKDMSPDDLAPDSLACVDSLNGVFNVAFGEPIQKGIVSTLALLEVMRTDPRFKEISVPELGCIVIAATGTAPDKKSHGHTGIWGHFDVMSNDSDTGLWRDNYTQSAFIKLFHYTLGFPLHYFRVVD